MPDPSNELDQLCEIDGHKWQYCHWIYMIDGGELFRCVKCKSEQIFIAHQVGPKKRWYEIIKILSC